MKDGQVKVITAGVDSRRRRIIYMVPLFLGAVAIGFLLELSTYETLNFAEIKLAIANLPHYRWNSFMSSYKVPEARDPADNLQEQAENETVILEDIPPPSRKTGEASTLELWEQPNLLNLKSFSWKMNNEKLCQVDPNVEPGKDTRLIPVLVHTARSHFVDRLAIRRTWGSIPIYKKWDVRFVFLLGEADRGSNPEVNQKEFEEEEKKLTAEQAIFGDIVVGSFIDSYHNLTYKHLMGYKWILNFCREATFVMKIDDDMFIDIMQWLDWRTGDVEKLEKDPTAKVPDLYCHTFGGTKPLRMVNSKWYASEQDWPDEYYPDYCSGWAYGITVDLIQRLYSVSNDIKFFWIDDVFATGALLEVVKKKYDYKPEIVHIWGNVTSDMIEYRPMCDKQAYDEKRLFRAVAYVPRGDLFERDMMCMWNKTLHDKNLQMQQP